MNVRKQIQKISELKFCDFDYADYNYYSNKVFTAMKLGFFLKSHLMNLRKAFAM